MAKDKFDAVVTAVHYGPDGQIAWVRAFKRRGPIWSDRLIIQRPALIEDLKQGKRYVVGRRLAQLGGTFETGGALQVSGRGQGEVISVDGMVTDQDHLEGVPLV